MIEADEGTIAKRALDLATAVLDLEATNIGLTRTLEMAEKSLTMMHEENNRLRGLLAQSQGAVA